MSAKVCPTHCNIIAGHRNEEFCLFAAFITADSKGKWVVCGSEDHAILLWDLNKKDVSLQASDTACMLCPLLIVCVLKLMFGLGKLCASG